MHRRSTVQRFMHAVFSEPRYYLYGVGIGLVLIALALVFILQTSGSSGGG
jgi:hypothetical protein